MDNGRSLLVVELSKPTQQLVVNLPASQRVSARIQGETLTICDDRGRLLVADLQARAWLRQHFL